MSKRKTIDDLAEMIDRSLLMARALNQPMAAYILEIARQEVSETRGKAQVRQPQPRIAPLNDNNHTDH